MTFLRFHFIFLYFWITKQRKLAHHKFRFSRKEGAVFWDTLLRGVSISTNNNALEEQGWSFFHHILAIIINSKFLQKIQLSSIDRGVWWLSGRVSDSGARGPGFETYLRRVVSLSKTLYSPKVLVNYPGSDGSVPTWLKNCWLGR